MVVSLLLVFFYKFHKILFLYSKLCNIIVKRVKNILRFYVRKTMINKILYCFRQTPKKAAVRTRNRHNREKLKITIFKKETIIIRVMSRLGS